MKKSLILIISFLMVLVLASCKTESKSTTTTKDNHSHEIEKISQVDATCTKDGYKEYYVCSSCGKMFSDSEAKNEIDIYEIIPKLGHNFGTDYSSNETSHYLECSRCEEKKNEGQHTFKTVIDKEPNGAESGLKHEECETCGYKKEPVVIETHECERNDFNFVSGREASFDREGLKSYYHCNICNKNFEDEAMYIEIEDLETWIIIPKTKLLDTVNQVESIENPFLSNIIKAKVKQLDQTNPDGDSEITYVKNDSYEGVYFSRSTSWDNAIDESTNYGFSEFRIPLDKNLRYMQASFDYVLIENNMEDFFSQPGDKATNCKTYVEAKDVNRGYYNTAEDHSSYYALLTPTTTLKTATVKLDNDGEFEFLSIKVYHFDGEIIVSNFRVLEVHEHVYQEIDKSNPTFEETGSVIKECTICKERKTDILPKLEHNYSTEYSKDTEYHYFLCTDTGYETLSTGKTKHSYNELGNCVCGNKITDSYTFLETTEEDLKTRTTLETLGITSGTPLPQTNTSHIFKSYDFIANGGLDITFAIKSNNIVTTNNNRAYIYLGNHSNEDGIILFFELNVAEDGTMHQIVTKRSEGTTATNINPISTNEIYYTCVNEAFKTTDTFLFRIQFTLIDAATETFNLKVYTGTTPEDLKLIQRNGEGINIDTSFGGSYFQGHNQIRISNDYRDGSVGTLYDIEDAPQAIYMIDGVSIGKVLPNENRSYPYPIINKEGYKFLGWFDENGNKFETGYNIKTKTFVNARFIKNQDFMVTLSDAGYTTENGMELTPTKEMGNPIPVKEGLTRIDTYFKLSYKAGPGDTYMFFMVPGDFIDEATRVQYRIWLSENQTTLNHLYLSSRPSDLGGEGPATEHSSSTFKMSDTNKYIVHTWIEEVDKSNDIYKVGIELINLGSGESVSFEVQLEFNNTKYSMSLENRNLIIFESVVGGATYTVTDAWDKE